MIYRMLMKGSIKHVAKCLWVASFVDWRRRRRNRLQSSSISKRLKRKMVCRRLVLDTVALTCQCLPGARYFYPVLPTLLRAPVPMLLLKLASLTISLPAAQQAYKIGILLNVDNIMIVKDKEIILLINWEMCLLWKNHEGGPRSELTVSYGWYVSDFVNADGWYIGYLCIHFPKNPKGSGS